MRRMRISCWSLLAGAGLSSCAATYPDIALDEPFMRPAERVSEHGAETRIEIVETPTPHPLPGQLMPVEAQSAVAPALAPFERIDRANERAKVEPSADRFVNSVQVYPFMEGALYRLYAAPEQVSDIALEPGERLHSISAGDTVRWIVGDTTSGGPAGERVHILIKPVSPNLKTNLMIATDRRAYHLEMRSFRETYMAGVSWTYPETELARRRANARAETSHSPATAGISPHDLKFRYRIEGDRPHWRPVRAFDDGRKVFIQFPDNIAQGDTPPLFTLSRKGDLELVNYRISGSYYVIDRLFAAAELRLGEKPQSVVRVVRTDLGDDLVRR